MCVDEHGNPQRCGGPGWLVQLELAFTSGVVVGFALAAFCFMRVARSDPPSRNTAGEGTDAAMKNK
jgi:hypothetical protein